MNTSERNQQVTTMPDLNGDELYLWQHVQRNTLAHPLWNELDHQHHLISVIGFTPEVVRANVEEIIHTMIRTRGKYLR